MLLDGRRRGKVASMAVTGGARLLLASNRGPVSFTRARRRRARRQPRRRRPGVRAVACGGGDDAAVGVRGAVRRPTGSRPGAPRRPAGPAGHDTRRVRMLDIDPVTFDRAYNGVANSTLWFVHHLLYDTPTRPRLRRPHRRRVGGLPGLQRRVRRGARRRTRRRARAVLVQDYHLALDAAAAARAAARPADRRTSATRRGRRRSTSACCPTTSPARCCSACSAPTPSASTPRGGRTRSAAAARRCSGRRATGRRTSRYGGRTTRVGGAPARRRRRRAARARAAAPDVQGRLPLLREHRRRPAAGRCASTAPSCRKNIVRGLEAYRELLRTRPEWHERVVHLAFAYPSRHDLPDYREYTGAVQRVAREVNEEFAPPGWRAGAPRGPRRLPALARGVLAGRRAARQPAARRHEPRRQGGAGAVGARLRRWCCRARPAPPTSSAPTRTWSTPTTCPATADALHEALRCPRPSGERGPTGWPRWRRGCHRRSGSPTRSSASTEAHEDGRRRRCGLHGPFLAEPRDHFSSTQGHKWYVGSRTWRCCATGRTPGSRPAPVVSVSQRERR